MSDFGRLRSYGHFLIPVHAHMWTASYGTSWRVMHSTWWLIVCVASIIFATWLAQFTTERQPVLRPAVAFSETSFKHRSIQIKGNFTKLTLHLYFKMYHVLRWFIILFRLLSIIVTFYSKFQTVINPQPSKIGHMFIWTFWSQRPRKSPPVVMSTSRETPCTCREAG